MARRLKKHRDPERTLGQIHLGSAVVPANDVQPEPVTWWTQAEAEAGLEVTDRTLRNWAEKGLPVRKGPQGRPIYPAEDCRAWAECWGDITANCQRYKREAPSCLTLLGALNWRELKRAMDGLGSWRPYQLVETVGIGWLDMLVLVPNDVSGRRARLLRLAAQGVGSEEPHEHLEDDRLLEAMGVPRGYSRLDIGWPPETETV